MVCFYLINTAGRPPPPPKKNTEIRERDDSNEQKPRWTKNIKWIPKKFRLLEGKTLKKYS